MTACRRIAKFSAALLLGLVAPSIHAQEFPNRTIELIVGFPAGGGTDANARALAELLGDKLGVSVVVENRPGGSSQVGIESVAAADPDGYTLIYATDSFLLLQVNGAPVTFSTEDFTPLARVRTSSMYIGVNANVPASTLPEFVELAKASPGEYSFASSGVGGYFHIVGEALQDEAGIDLLHVPYQGGAPAMVDAVAGRVDMVVAGAGDIQPFVESGQIKPLATTGEKPAEFLQEFPPMSEFYPGFDFSTWHGVLAPKGLPEEIAEKLSKAIKEVSESPEFLETSMATGAIDTPVLTGNEFGDFLAQTRDKFETLIEETGLTFGR